MDCQAYLGPLACQERKEIEDHQVLLDLQGNKDQKDPLEDLECLV